MGLQLQVSPGRVHRERTPPPPPPPHSVLFRVRICSFPPFESTPYLRTDTISEPPFRGLFAGFSCLGDPPKSKTLLNLPPIFYFITPFLNFSGVQRERERKTTPFLKKSPGEKSNTPPFFFFTILGPDFVARKVPLYRRFWEHACGPSDPGVGGRGAYAVCFFCVCFVVFALFPPPQKKSKINAAVCFSFLGRIGAAVTLFAGPGARGGGGGGLSDRFRWGTSCPCPPFET